MFEYVFFCLVFIYFTLNRNFSSQLLLIDWWIGLQHNNTEGTFNWVSGQPLTYTDWYQGTPIQPDNKNKAGAGPANCAALVFSYQYQWGDENCDSPKQMICESRQVFNTSFFYSILPFILSKYYWLHSVLVT